MCNKLIYLISVLMLSVTCTGHADTVIGDWENGSYDGWIDWGAGQATIESIGEPKYTFSPIGATLGSSALKVSPGSGWQQNLSISLGDIGAMDAFLANKAFAIDVTYNSADWDSATTYAQVYHVSFNNDGFGWHDVGGSAAPDGTAGVVFTDTLNPDAPGTMPLIDPGTEGTTITGTWIWDYSGVIDQFENPSYIQIVIATNSNAPGAFYFDNARLIGSGNLRAENPSPADEETDVERYPTLIWKRGTNINTHNIYLGTNFNDVNDATADVHPNVTFAQLDVNNFTPGNLEFDTTYYWRVDEVNNTDLWKGIVWNFTTGNYIVIDDFESYNDLNPDIEGSNRIFLAWIDGYNNITENGALVGYNDFPFTEQTNVHGGKQAMPLRYDNNMKYSEAKLTLSNHRNWSEDGIKALSLWFYGNPANSPEQMYVAIADSTNSPVVVKHDEPALLQVTEWQEWPINLVLFENGGIDLTDVNSIAIGFGDKNNIAAGGSGTVFIDDIRLYPLRCVLSARSAEFARLDFMPVGNPAGDCMINYQELSILARDWLVTDEVIATTPPGSTGLVGYYQFESGTGTDAVDSSGNHHNGTLTTDLTWSSPGILNSNYAVHFDGTAGSRISIGTWNPAAGTGAMTLALWVRWAGPRDPHGGQPQGLVCKREAWSTDGLMFMFEMDTPDSADTRGSIALRQYSGENTDVYSEANVMDQFIGRWVHVAATFDGTTARLYLNGSEIASGPFSFADGTDVDMTIGNNNNDIWPDSPGAFNGDMDEVRIYNRALSAAQIAYLADTTPADGQLHSVPSPAELFEAVTQGTLVVNFADFAVLADKWLDEMFWP
ncbi:MAG: LamG domain-containing protein [Sedimentisphaerales bacterium]|nr:LamG domain-containing protein [Sedimentisphaerales bacterium]